MTNSELKRDILENLPGYQIGLHQINEDCYRRALEWDSDASIFLGKPYASKKEIANSIFEKGLIVLKDENGPLSTVTFLGENGSNGFNSEDFDYSYYPYKSYEDLESFVVIVAIPSYINVFGKKIFMGDLHTLYNVGNYVLFRRLLPKEFIYGYYRKGVKPFDNKYLDMDMVHEFDDEVFFRKNPNHISCMNEDDRKMFLANFIRKSEIKLSSFKMLNTKTGRFVLKLSDYGRMIINNDDQEKRFVLKF